MFDNHVSQLFPDPPFLSNLRILSSGRAHTIDAHFVKKTKHRDLAFCSQSPLLALLACHLAQGLPGLAIASATCGGFKSNPGIPGPVNPLTTATTVMVNVY